MRSVRRQREEFSFFSVFFFFSNSSPRPFITPPPYTRAPTYYYHYLTDGLPRVRLITTGHRRALRLQCCYSAYIIIIICSYTHPAVRAYLSVICDVFAQITRRWRILLFITYYYIESSIHPHHVATTTTTTAHYNKINCILARPPAIRQSHYRLGKVRFAMRPGLARTIPGFEHGGPKVFRVVLMSRNVISMLTFCLLSYTWLKNNWRFIDN